MYPKVLLTNNWMEDNLEIHMEKVHLEEIRLEDHHLNQSFEWPTLDPHMFIPPWYQ
jgi:hypothetical protein